MLLVVLIHKLSHLVNTGNYSNLNADEVLVTCNFGDTSQYGFHFHGVNSTGKKNKMALVHCIETTEIPQAIQLN